MFSFCLLGAGKARIILVCSDVTHQMMAVQMEEDIQMWTNSNLIEFKPLYVLAHADNPEV